jgi:hypothetical protein
MEAQVLSVDVTTNTTYTASVIKYVRHYDCNALIEIIK